MGAPSRREEPLRPDRITGPYGLAGRRTRWLLELEGAELCLIEREADLDDLIRRGRITAATPIYEVGARAVALGDIPELARSLASPIDSEPPVRSHADDRSGERAQLSEELAILNRPLEDDVEYYDEVPVRRWPRRLAVVVALAAVAGGGYRILGPRLSSWPVATHLLPPNASSAVSSSAQAVALSNVEAAALGAPAGPPSQTMEHPSPAAVPAAPPVARDPELAPAAEPVQAGPKPSKPYRALVLDADRMLERGRGRQAEQLYEEALQQKPTGVEALTGLGYVSLDRGQAGKAISVFKRALAHDKAFAPALFGLGEAYREQKDRARAADAFERYLALHPSGRDAGAAKRQLKQLGAR